MSDEYDYVGKRLEAAARLRTRLEALRDKWRRQGTSRETVYARDCYRWCADDLERVLKGGE